MKLIFHILFLFFLIENSRAQSPLQGLKKSFDSIEYYSNGNVKCAYSIKKHKIHGYAIEFDEMGYAMAIGKYKKSKKAGRWQNRNGSFESFEKGQSTIIGFPGCGTGARIYKEEFVILYYKLIGIKYAKNFSENKVNPIRNL